MDPVVKITLELLVVPLLSGVVTLVITIINRKKSREEVRLLVSQVKKADAESELIEAQADATTSAQWVTIVAELRSQLRELKEAQGNSDQTILRLGNEIAALKDSNLEKDRRIQDLERQNVEKDQQILILQGEIDKLKKGEC